MKKFKDFEEIKEFILDNDDLSKRLLDDLGLCIYSIVSENSDLGKLSKILDEKSLLAIIKEFENSIIVIPSLEEYKDCLLLISIFYLKEIYGYKWYDIKIKLNLPDDFNAFLFGRKVKDIKYKILDKFRKIMEEVYVE